MPAFFMPMPKSTYPLQLLLRFVAFGFSFVLSPATVMAYNKHNYMRHVRHIVATYHRLKTEDIPDSHVVRVLFPKENIYISYRTWMNIKNMKVAAPKNPQQISMAF